MFASSDPNLADLDFELLDERQQQQSQTQQQQHQHQQQQQTNTLFNESMLKELLTGGSANYRIVKTGTTNKRSSNQSLRRQLTDESSMKQQRTPPNSTGTSLSPLSQSFLTRLPSSISESNPIRIGNLLPSNTIRLASPTTTKPIETINVLLKQNLPSTPIVQTRLENPTKYHLEQISRKQTLVNEEPPILPQVVQHEESSPDSEITSEMDDQLNDDTTCGSVESHTRGINITPRLSTTLTTDNIGSVFLSSSLTKDSLDSSSRHSSSCPTNILSAKAKIGLPLTEDEMRLVIRDRQKKDNHNMIERRRRFNINDRIKELGTLLPKGTDLDMKQNKGTILRASVDYIKILRRQYENASLVEEKCHMLTEENLALQERVKELERKCVSHGIPIQPTMIKSSAAIPMVKEEPSSLSSSLSNNPTVPPSTPIFTGFEPFPSFDSPQTFALADEDSNDTNSHGTAAAASAAHHRDPLSPLGQDPFLSSTSFGFDHEMDIGGGGFA